MKTQTEIVRMTGDGQLADVEIHNISTSATESSTSSSNLHSNNSHSHNTLATLAVAPSSQTELLSLNGDYSSAPGGHPESDYDDDDDLPLQLDQAGVSDNIMNLAYFYEMLANEVHSQDFVKIHLAYEFALISLRPVNLSTTALDTLIFFGFN